MSRMHIADLKSGPLPGKPSRTQSRKPPFVSNLGKRISLIHELGKLAAAEELLDRGGNRLGIDQIVRHHGFSFLQIHPLPDRPLHSHQSHPILVFHQLTHSPHSAIAQVVDVINGALGVFKANQKANRFHDVFSS